MLFEIWRYGIREDLKTEKRQEMSSSKQSPKPIRLQLHLIPVFYFV